jgi:hypothetical protein
VSEESSNCSGSKISDDEIRETLHFTEFKSVREPRGIDDSATESGELVDIENEQL